MTGYGSRSIIAENLTAVNPAITANQVMNRQPRMCWKCQKSKQTKDGHIKMYPGLMKFICKDCLEAKVKAKEKSA